MLFILGLYLATVVFSFAVLFSVYSRASKESRYLFSAREKILGLVIVPLVPVLNVVIAFMHT